MLVQLLLARLVMVVVMVVATEKPSRLRLMVVTSAENVKASVGVAHLTLLLLLLLLLKSEHLLLLLLLLGEKGVATTF